MSGTGTALSLEQLRAVTSPRGFARSILKADPWSKQDEILDAVGAPHSSTACKACHSSGKTFIAAACVLWHLVAFDESITITTAPTWPQVRRLLWADIERLRMQAGLIFPKMNEVELAFGRSNYAIGLSTDEGVRFQGFHCFDEEHEILTRRGWLGIDEMTENDEVLSVPVNGSVSEWMPVTAVHRYPHSGDLNVYESDAVSFAVTDGHRFVTKNQHASNGWSILSLDEARNRWSQFRIRRVAGWKGEPMEVPAPFRKYGWSPERFAEFLGFWIGDGGTRRHSTGRFYEVILYQTKPDGGYVERLLDGVRFGRGRDYIALCDRACAEWLVEHVGRYGKDRIVPRVLLDAPPETLDAFLEGFWRAEGSYGSDGKKKQAYNTSRVLIDQIQEMLLKLGRPATIGVNTAKGATHHALGRSFEARENCWTIRYTERSSDYQVVDPGSIQKQRHEGRVWCISTPHETFFTRRRGRVFLSGNSKNILVVIDEGPGVREDIWEAIEGIRAGGDVRVLTLGNPTIAGGAFEAAFGSQSAYRKITISAFDTPNLAVQTDDARELGLPTARVGSPLEVDELALLSEERMAWSARPYLTQRAWVLEKYREWGPTDPRYEARVLGHFPSAAKNALIIREWVDRALLRGRVEREYLQPAVAPGYLEAGIDVAGPGDSETVATIRGGDAILAQASWPDPRPERQVIRFLDRYRAGLIAGPNRPAIKVDSAGEGYYLVPILEEAGYRGYVCGVSVGEMATAFLDERMDPHAFADAKKRYQNLKARLYWELRERFQQGRVVALGLADRAIRQLTALRWAEHPVSQKIEIETKRDMRERGEESPDFAESIMLAFAEITPVFLPSALATRRLHIRHRGTVTTARHRPR